MNITEEQLRLMIKSALLREATMSQRSLKDPSLKTSNDQSSSTTSTVNPETDGSTGSFETSQGGPKINDLDRVAQKPIKDFINALNKNGYSVILTSAYRSIAKQKSVSSSVKAKAGYSSHNFGLAIDLNLKWKNKDGTEQMLKMKNSKQEWEKVIGPNGVVPYTKYNLRWGGTFERYDPVHFDVYPQLSVPDEDDKKADKYPSDFANALRKKAGGKDMKYSDIIND